MLSQAANTQAPICSTLTTVNSPAASTAAGDSADAKRINLTDNMKQFYKDLVEITIDFMSNNMFFDNSANSQLTSINNKNEFFIDTYSNGSTSNL
jgi:hypothetical protein